jgi:ABC-type sulfate transport system substrate-binding protein
MKLKKVLKLLGTGVKEDLDALSEKGLRDSIISSETAIREIRTQMDADERLREVKEMLKDFAGAYRDAQNAQQAKIQYALHRLEEMGKL